MAELGIGPGIEIVASQMVPTYPVVGDDFVRTWRAAFDRHGFVESSFGANLDMGRRRDRDMTPDEEFAFSKLMFEGRRSSASRSCASRAPSPICCVGCCRSPSSSS